MPVHPQRGRQTSRSLKILMVHNAYQQRGGEDVAVAAETKLLRSYGHEVIDLIRDNAVIPRSRRLLLLRDTLWSTSAADEVRGAIRANEPDLIHVHNTFPQFSPSIYWAADRCGVPVFQTLHNFRLLCAQAMFLRNGGICEDCMGTLPWRGILRKCYRKSSVQSGALVSMLALHRTIGTFRRKVTRYIALSNFSKERFIQGGLPASKLRIKPNFVDIALGEQSQRSGGLFVGRLSEEKGLRVLVRALDAVPLDVECDVIGTGPEANLAMGHRKCRLLGWQSPDQIYGRMRRAAYLILPSIGYEQFPRTLAEAFGCGLPIIASRLGPLAELIRDGQTGLLFQPGSSVDLARKIEIAERNPELLREMSLNARREYEGNYTAERNYQQLMSIYHEVLSPSEQETEYEEPKKF